MQLSRCGFDATFHTPVGEYLMLPQLPLAPLCVYNYIHTYIHKICESAKLSFRLSLDNSFSLIGHNFHMEKRKMCCVLCALVCIKLSFSPNFPLKRSIYSDKKRSFHGQYIVYKNKLKKGPVFFWSVVLKKKEEEEKKMKS